MIIYRETKGRYLSDVDGNVLKSRLVDAFLSKTGSVPSDNYVWADEYSRFAAALSKAPVDDNVDVALEYHITSAGRFRVDALLAGNDGTQDTVVIVELKAWEAAEASDAYNVVLCPAAGDPRRSHPCAQARKYKGLILRFNQDVPRYQIRLESAAYLFNLRRRKPEPLEDSRYADVLSDTKLFLADDVSSLRAFLGKIVPRQATRDILFVLENGRLVPCDSLIERVSSMLEGNTEFELIDEQDVAFEVIRHALFVARGPLQRHVFIVEGGPGTGKSVIAVRLLAEMLKAKRMGYLVAPNRAFRESLIDALSRGNRGYRDDGEAIIRSSWSFHQENYDENSKYDVFIVDEAHRLKDQAHMYEGEDMVEDMVRAARIGVFFIDEGQRVSWHDIGSIDYIRAVAEKFGAKLHEPFKLTAQFRCNGSSGYLNWIDDVLEIRPTANFDNWGSGQYDFKVFDRAKDLYEALRTKNTENKARLIAGYSWEWPKRGRKRGTIAKHVQADDLSLPWNYEGENWATGKDAIEQVGCIHTSQGVEFDWLGVLIGADLKYEGRRIIGDPKARAKNDASLKGWKKDYRNAKGDVARQQAVLDKVQSIIKSTYKVLLTRGRRGCYVWCADEALREYLKERVRLVSKEDKEETIVSRELELKVIHKPFETLPLRLIPDEDVKPYLNGVPVVDLQIAAGAFSDDQWTSPNKWVELPDAFVPKQGYFVARVVGESMNRRIPNGSWCLFKIPSAGSRQGKVVLVQSRNIQDPEVGGQYTIKLYQSEKRVTEDSWEHNRIILKPDSTIPSFSDLVLEGDATRELTVRGELVAVLGQK